MGKQMRLELAADEEEVVAKANDLVRARHTFSTYEQRIFASMVARLKRGSKKFPIQQIPVTQICDRSNSSDLYRRLDEISKRLTNRKIVIRKTDDAGNRSFERINVFSKCKYKEGEGTIEARFTEDMRPFLLELKERFTLYLITVFLRLQSKYSTQIYELLKMRQGLQKIEMSVKEFRDVLALEDKYEQFYSLKKRVIEQARKELKEKADIFFTYDVIRDGRTPVAITFFIHTNEDVVEEVEEKALKVAESSESRDGQSPRIDPKSMFLSDRTQEELEKLDREEVQQMYEKAQKRAREAYSNRSEGIVKERTYAYMSEIWKER
jgi:plasmid replication initiation protein